MSEQPNPIPSSVRGWLLVAAIICAGFTAAVVSTMQGLGAASWAITAAASVLTAVPMVAASLSRANLTLDPPKDGGQS